jgi:hypothetical protein
LPEFGHWKVILERACKMLPISKIDSEFLSIATCDTVGLVNWAELFKRCTTVTTIQAIGHETGGLIRDLTPPNTKEGKKKKRDDSGTSAIYTVARAYYCPQPEVAGIPRLGLHRNQVPLRRPVQRSRQWPPTAQFNVQRHGAHRLRKIRVDHCVIPVKRANALKRLVTEFHWDREEGLINAFDEFEDFEDYDSNLIGPEARWEDFFVGSTQVEWEWLENYSDGW